MFGIVGSNAVYPLLHVCSLRIATQAAVTGVSGLSGPEIAKKSKSAKTKRGRREGDGKKSVTTIYDNLRHFATFYDNFRLFIPLT